MERFAEHTDFSKSVAFSPDSRFVISAGYKYYKGPADWQFNDFARLWELATGEEGRRFIGHTGDVMSVAFSPDGRYVATGSNDGTARVWEVANGRQVWRFLHDAPARTLAFSPDGRFVLTIDNVRVHLWNTTTGIEVWREWLNQGENSGGNLGDFERFSADGRFVMMRSHRRVHLLEIATGQIIRRYEYPSYASIIGLMPDRRFLVRNADDTVGFWDLSTEKKMQSFKGITSGGVSPDGRFIVTPSGGTTRLWEVATNRELGRLISFRDGTWVVVDPKGRFDTNNLEEIRGLHWIMPDEPLNPLPLEIYMREYYEPGLLPKLLAGERLANVPDITQRNRLRPQVAIKSIEPSSDAAGSVDIKVEVMTSKVSSPTTNPRQADTRVFDLRLFREGQMVGYWPSGSTPGELAEIKIDVSGKRIIPFRNIKLPAGSKNVQFSAYAINHHRVRSDIARQSFKLETPLPPAGRRAYVVTFGVNVTDSPEWWKPLHQAADDARLMHDELVEALRSTGEHQDVIGVSLVAVDDWWGLCKKRTATAENLRTVLRRLSGKPVTQSELDIWAVHCT